MDLENPFTVYAPGLAGISRDERFLSPGVVRRIVARGDANLVLRNVLRMLFLNRGSWDNFIGDIRSIFPNIDFDVSFNEGVDENIQVYFRMPGASRLPIDAAGTSILQACQLIGYICLFKPTVLILDEPDSHLHPDNQRALCDLILRLAPIRNFQALISTHSRHVLDAMRGRSSIVWLSRGRKVDEPDINLTSLLLELGALDSIDYFADGEIRWVVATEDTHKEPLKALLWSNGFNEDDTEVASYTGCSKVDSAKVLGGFLRDKAPHVRLIIHRDRDYMGDARAERFEQELSGAGIGAFLTITNDVEGYFINPEHLSSVNTGLSVIRAQYFIEQATNETRTKSIEALVNLRTQEAFQLRRDGGTTPNHGAIATSSIADYDAYPHLMRRGKIVLNRVAALIQQEIGNNPRIYVPSQHLRCEALETIKTRLGF